MPLDWGINNCGEIPLANQHGASAQAREREREGETGLLALHSLELDIRSPGLGFMKGVSRFIYLQATGESG